MNWNSGIMGKLGNSVRAHVLSMALTSGAVATAGCEGDPRIKMDTQGGSPGLPTPQPSETTPTNPTPRDNFAKCLPPDRSLELRVKAHFGGTVAIGIMSVKRPLNFTSDTKFTGVAVWVSNPPEEYTQDPLSENYDTRIAVRAKARSSGAGMDRLTSDGILGFWSDQFPTTFSQATQMGFYWVVNGTFNPDSCDTQLTFQSTEISPDGVRGKPLPFLTSAVYTPRANGDEGLAEAGFQNERVAIYNGSPTLAFKGPTEAQRGQYVSQSVVVSMNKEDFVPGNNDNSVLMPEMLEMEIISLPRDGEVAPAQEMPTTPAPDGGTSDGGIPGLPGPQPEEMTPTA